MASNDAATDLAALYNQRVLDSAVVIWSAVKIPGIEGARVPNVPRVGRLTGTTKTAGKLIVVDLAIRAAEEEDEERDKGSTHRAHCRPTLAGSQLKGFRRYHSRVPV